MKENRPRRPRPGAKKGEKKLRFRPKRRSPGETPREGGFQPRPRPRSRVSAQRGVRDTRQESPPSLRGAPRPGLISLGVLTAPGVGRWVLRELEQRGIPVEHGEVRRLKNHDFIRLDGDQSHVPAILELRTCEDVFVLIAHDMALSTKLQLQRLARFDLKKGILEGLRWKSKPRQEGKRATDFWVFIKQDRDYEVYRRDVANIVVDNLRRSFRHWRAQEPADVEIWGFLIDERLTLGLRLTELSHRQRKYRTSERPGSLRPPIAAALVVMSDPHPSDEFFDPMCGSGTIVLERALWGPTRRLCGGEIDRAAVEISRASAQAARVEADFLLIDATQSDTLSSQIGQVNRIVCNLPFGKRFTTADLATLYRNCLKAWRGLLLPGGTITVLTPEHRALTRAAEEARLSVRMLGRIDVQGIRAAAYRLRPER